MAGFTATGKFIGLVEIAAMSFGYAMMSYCGQNLKVKRLDRIQQGVRQMLVFEFGFSCVLALFLFCLPVCWEPVVYIMLNQPLGWGQGFSWLLVIHIKLKHKKMSLMTDDSANQGHF